LGQRWIGRWRPDRSSLDWRGGASTGYPFYLMIARASNSFPSFVGLSHQPVVGNRHMFARFGLLACQVMNTAKWPGWPPDFAFALPLWSGRSRDYGSFMDCTPSSRLPFISYERFGTNLRRARWIVLMGIIFGLRLANHITTILLLPLLFFRLIRIATTTQSLHLVSFWIKELAS